MVFLLHSHEDQEYNMDRVDLEYTVLAPDYTHSKADDPKNENRFYLD